jgi:hypothetical protein
MDSNLAILIISFFIGVILTRWIFQVPTIVSSLEKQNELSRLQIKLLRKLLVQNGVPLDEINKEIESVFPAGKNTK